MYYQSINKVISYHLLILYGEYSFLFWECYVVLLATDAKDGKLKTERFTFLLVASVKSLRRTDGNTMRAKT